MHLALETGQAQLDKRQDGYPVLTAGYIEMRFTRWPGTKRLHRALGGFADSLFDRNLKARRFNYPFQCGLATVSLMVEDMVFSAAIVAALASSAVTVFVSPNSLASTPRKVVGGHAVAVVTVAIVTAILALPIIAGAEQYSRLATDIGAVLAVGLGTLIMVATNTEHPPAAGTALGLVISLCSWSAIIFIMSSAAALSIVRIALRTKLVNPL